MTVFSAQDAAAARLRSALSGPMYHARPTKKLMQVRRVADFRCRREPTLAKTWKRTFRKDHAAEPGVTYIAGRRPIFAAKAKVQTILMASRLTCDA